MPGMIAIFLTFISIPRTSYPQSVESKSESEEEAVGFDSSVEYIIMQNHSDL